MFSREMLDRRLQAIRDKKRERELYLQGPQDPSDYMPASLAYEPQKNEGLTLNAINSVGVMGSNETAIEKVKAQNFRDAEMMRQAQDELLRAQERFNNRPTVKVKQQNPGEVTIVQGKVRQVGRPNAPVASPNTGKGDYSKKRWGKDGLPEVSDIRNKDPWSGKHGKLVSVNWRGRRFVVNGKVAPIFTALLDDLWAAGYRPKVIGGYNDRNIAGTSVKSLHSYGYAIDIDPSENFVQDNDGSMEHILPSNVRALAKKYGLSWGGNWSSYKDPMHFSMPYGGRE